MALGELGVAIRPAAQYPEIFTVTGISRAAILKLGATQEGIFRKHMIMPDGHVRDSVFFSIVDTDWPVVKAGLEKRLIGALTSRSAS